MPQKEIVVGIDIGGTTTVIGLIDAEGTILATSHFATEAFPDIAAYIREMARQITTLLLPFSTEYSMKGIGIGAPNGNFYHGTIEHAPNLVWKGIIPLAAMVNKIMDTPVLVTNDANAAALGEMIFGGAKGMKNFIEITIGTGLGSGFVANGALIYGHHGLAGELGHTIAIRNGRACTCGRFGCLEAYVSKRGMIQTFTEMMTSNTDEIKESDAMDLQSITPAMITEMAMNGNAIALKIFDETGKILGLTLADSVCYTEPEAIFIFGGIAMAGDLLLNPIRHYMETNLHHIYRGKIAVLPSSLPNNSAAILGAAALIWNQI